MAFPLFSAKLLQIAGLLAALYCYISTAMSQKETSSLYSTSQLNTSAGNTDTVQNYSIGCTFYNMCHTDYHCGKLV